MKTQLLVLAALFAMVKADDPVVEDPYVPCEDEETSKMAIILTAV